MTDKARALIAEGRKHDEAMRRPGFRFTCDCLTCREIRSSLQPWFHTNLASLLDHLGAALDENERLRAGLAELRTLVEDWGDGGYYNERIDAILAPPTNKET